MSCLTKPHLLTTREKLPSVRLQPMHATPGVLPPNPESFAFEFRWEGYRALLRWDGRRMQLRSRNKRDLLALFPEISAAGAALPHPLLIDGAIVAIDESGTIDGDMILSRGDTQQTQRLVWDPARWSVVYVIFDLLHYAGQGLLTCTWQERRTALVGLSLHGPHWATPPVYDDYAPLMATARVRGGHGILAKDRRGIYHPGIASPEWIDIGLDASACLVIGGYQREADGRGIRALMLGYFAKARDATRGILSYAGMVMANLDEPMLVELHQLLSSCEARSSPFTIINHLHDVVWCQPLITVEISDIAWLSKGQFSHARLVRLHPEVEPRTVLAPH